MIARDHSTDPVVWDVSNKLHPCQETPGGGKEGESLPPSSFHHPTGAADAAGGHGWSQCWCRGDTRPCWPPPTPARSPQPLPPALPARRVPFRKADRSAQPSARAVERWNQSRPGLGCRDRFLFRLIIQGSLGGWEDDIISHPVPIATLPFASLFLVISLHLKLHAAKELGTPRHYIL